MPVAIKDDLEVAGLRFTCGSRLRENVIGKSDDLTVARLRKAGAIILGKTNEPEFGHKGVTENKLFGTTPTPWNLDRTAGGSSGGSAAAVAAGLAYLALGTDIAGSVRIPASCCGIVGFKPSFGRIPRVPGYNAFVTQWYIGPLARTVADTALALRVLAGPDDRDPFSLPALGKDDLSLEGDLGEPAADLSARAQPECPWNTEVAKAAEKTVRLLEKRGVKIVVRKDPLPPAPLDALRVIFRAVSLADAGIKDEADFRKKRDLLTDTFAAFVEPGLKLTLGDYLEAQAERDDVPGAVGPGLLEGLRRAGDPDPRRAAVLDETADGAGPGRGQEDRSAPGMGLHLAVQPHRPARGIDPVRMDERWAASGTAARGSARRRRPVTARRSGH